MKTNASQLIPLAQFERTGRSPVNMRWLIFHQKEQLQEDARAHRAGAAAGGRAASGWQVPA